MEILSGKQAVEYLNNHKVVMCNRTLRRKLNANIIKGNLLGRDWAIAEEELDRYIKRQK